MHGLTRRGLLKAVGIGSAAIAAGPLAARLLADDAPAKPVTITLYNTGDLHDHSGSLAKIAGYVKARKKQDPNTLFVDAGDICNKGEGFMAATQAEGMFHLMSACGYDAAVLGNWDYTFGKDRVLDVCTKHKTFPLMLCNMKWEGKDIERTRHIPKFRMYEFGGVKLALCGGGSHYKNHYNAGNPFPLFHEREGYKEALVDIKKQSPDVNVFISHVWERSDRNLINAWVEDAPHLMIGGHSHANSAFTYGAEGAERKSLVVRAGFWGRALRATTITVDPKTKAVLSLTSRSMKIGDDWPVDEEVAQLRKWYADGRPKKTAMVMSSAAASA